MKDGRAAAYMALTEGSHQLPDPPRTSAFLRTPAIAMAIGAMLGASCNEFAKTTSSDPATTGEAMVDGAMVGLLFAFIPAVLAAGAAEIARGKRGDPSGLAPCPIEPHNVRATGAPVIVVSGGTVPDRSEWWRLTRLWGLGMMLNVYLFTGMLAERLAGSSLPLLVSLLVVLGSAFHGRRSLDEPGYGIRLGLWSGGVGLLSTIVLVILMMPAGAGPHLGVGAILMASLVGAWLGGVRWTARGFES